MEILYNKCGQDLKFNLNDNFISSGLYGSVYKIDDSKCLKIFNSLNTCEGSSLEVISLIKKLKLKNFYEIYEILFNKNGMFKGYIMKYYQNNNIDILTMPTEYLLDNISGIYNSVLELTLNNIQVNDMTGNNVILGDNEITIIDVDLFLYNKNFNYYDLLNANVKSISFLFEELFLYSLIKYHNYIQEIFDYYPLFDKISPTLGISSFCSEFNGYRYPIDYIMKKVRTR